MAPNFAEIPFPFIFPLVRKLQVRFGNEKDSFGGKLISSGMLEMEVEIYRVADVLRPEVDFFRLREPRIFAAQGFGSLGQPILPGGGVLKYAGVRPGVEEDVSPGRKGGFPI
jgi:hypothetical protein